MTRASPGSDGWGAGRRVPRPAAVAPCPACGDLLGRGYPRCPACHEAVEGLWLADWAALLAEEGVAPGGDDEAILARVIVAEGAQHPWTIADLALTRARCQTCGRELGGGPTSCAECALAFGNLWAPEHEAGATMNEHALRVGRLVARHAHRYSAGLAAGWRLSLPLLLVGMLPSTVEAQALKAWVDAGRGDELLGYRTFAAAYAHTRRGRS